jgi:hypothetical protein
MSFTINKNGEFNIELEGFIIYGKSVGGRETAIVIKNLSIIFDVGYQATNLETMANVLISHGHCDHISCFLIAIAINIVIDKNIIL